MRSDSAGPSLSKGTKEEPKASRECLFCDGHVGVFSPYFDSALLTLRQREQHPLLPPNPLTGSPPPFSTQSLRLSLGIPASYGSSTQSRHISSRRGHARQSSCLRIQIQSVFVAIFPVRLPASLCSRETPSVSDAPVAPASAPPPRRKETSPQIHSLAHKPSPANPAALHTPGGRSAASSSSGLPSPLSPASRPVRCRFRSLSQDPRSGLRFSPSPTHRAIPL